MKSCVSFQKHQRTLISKVNDKEHDVLVKVACKASAVVFLFHISYSFVHPLSHLCNIGQVSYSL
jgi:hypothetical protein